MNLNKIKELGKALSNSYRVKIIKICSEPHNITEIKKKLDLSYKTTYNHVKVLENASLVKTEIKINNRGKNVMVTSLIKIEDEGVKYLKS